MKTEGSEEEGPLALELYDQGMHVNVSLAMKVFAMDAETMKDKLCAQARAHVVVLQCGEGARVTHKQSLFIQ